MGNPTGYNTNVDVNVTAHDNASATMDKVTEKVNRLGRSMRLVKREHKEMSKESTKSTLTFQGFAGATDKYTRTVTVVNGRIKNVTDTLNKNSNATRRTADATSRWGKEANKAQTATNKLMRSLGRIALYRIIRSFLSYITNGIKENIEVMAQLDDSVNETMSRFNSASKVTQAAITSLSVPLYEIGSYILPVLSEGLAGMANTLSYLTSVIKGNGTYLKVNTDYWDNYAKAVKEAKAQLLGFDKFNSLSGNKDADLGELFETIDTGEGLAKDDILGTLGLAGGIAALVAGIKLLNPKMRAKNKLLQKQSEATATDAKATSSLVSGLGLLATAAVLLTGGLGGLDDALARIGAYGKGGDDEIDLSLGDPAIGEGVAQITGQVEGLLVGLGGAKNEANSLGGAVGSAFDEIAVAYKQKLEPLPKRFTSLTQTSFLHLAEEIRSVSQMAGESMNAQWADSANKLVANYKAAIDEINRYAKGEASKAPEGSVAAPGTKAPKPSLYKPVDLQSDGSVGYTPVPKPSASEAPDINTKTFFTVYGKLVESKLVQQAGSSAQGAADLLDMLLKSLADFGKDILDNLPLIGGLIPIPAFAGGGIASQGTLFRAGESGAEVVSYLGGGQTGVMNIEQFEEASYRGVSRALYDNRGIFEQEVHGDVYMNGDRVGKITANGVYKEGVRVGYFNKR